MAKGIFSIITEWLSGRVKLLKPAKIQTHKTSGDNGNNETKSNIPTAAPAVKSSGHEVIGTPAPSISTGGSVTVNPSLTSTDRNITNSISAGMKSSSFSPPAGYSKTSAGGTVSAPGVKHKFGHAGARVIIKANFFRGIQKANAHLKYIEHRQYDERSELFGQDRDKLDREWFTEKLGKYDAIHRIVISPEDKNINLKELVRETMEQFAKKKDRELTWIAAIHKNPEHTKHPHIHLVLSGADKNGRKVRIEMPDIEYLKEITSKYVAREKNLSNAMGRFFKEREKEKERKREQGIER